MSERLPKSNLNSESESERSMRISREMDEEKREAEALMENIPPEITEYVEEYMKRWADPTLTFEGSERMSREMQDRSKADPTYRLAYLLKRYPDPESREGELNGEIYSLARELVRRKKGGR